MSNPPFVAVLIAVVLATDLLAVCGDSLSPEEAVAASGDHFADV